MSPIQADQADTDGTPGQDASDPLFSARLSFAERCFINVQELNRAIDVKANFLLAAVGLLTAALGLLASNALGGKHDFDWYGLLRGVGMGLTLLYLLLAFGVIHGATAVYRARPNSVKPDTTAPGLIFPLMLLNRFVTDGKADEEMYLRKLSTISPTELLHDYSNQIIEASSIYQSKQAQMNASLGRFQWMGIVWVVTMVVLVSLTISAP